MSEEYWKERLNDVSRGIRRKTMKEIWVISISGYGSFLFGRRSLCTNLSKGTYKVYPDGHIIEKPTFSIFGGMAKPFLKAMATELHNLGIKAEGEPILENELSAVKYHLEDMRSLVFQENKIINLEDKNEKKKD